MHTFTCCGSPTHLELWWGAGPGRSQIPKFQATPSILGPLCSPGQCRARCAVTSCGTAVFAPSSQHAASKPPRRALVAPTAPAQGQQPSRAASGTCAGTGQSSDAAGSLCVPSCSCPGKGTGSRARQGWLRVPKEYPVPKSEAPLSFPSDTRGSQGSTLMNPELLISPCCSEQAGQALHIQQGNIHGRFPPHRSAPCPRGTGEG